MLKLKTSIYTIIIFINITIFTSLSISTFQSILKDSITNGENISKTSVNCNLTYENLMSKEDFLKVIYSSDDIYFEKIGLNPGAFSGKAIYFNSDKKVKPNMISGKYFDNKDCVSEDPLAIVGKDVLKTTKEIDGQRYFEYENVKYKVIGVMGYENRKSLCDLSFIVNLNGYIKNTKSFTAQGNYLIDSLNDKKETPNIFIDKLKKIDKNINVKNLDSNVGLLSNFIHEGINVSIIFIVVIFLIFINVFNITLQWIDSKKKSIGIKKALGGTNFKISLEIITEYQLLALISYIIGTLLYMAIIKLRLISIFNADLYLLSSFITFIFSSVIAFLTSLFAIIRALKVSPCIIMKGGL